MRVCIYATEGQYGGLHGISDLAVLEVDNIDEANEIGYDMAAGVVESFGLIEEYEYEEEIDMELDWIVYHIKDSVTLSTKELDKIACNLGVELFVEKYCDNILI